MQETVLTRVSAFSLITFICMDSHFVVDFFAVDFYFDLLITIEFIIDT